MRRLREGVTAPAVALLLLALAALVVSREPPAPGASAWTKGLAAATGPFAVALMELLPAFAAGAVGAAFLILLVLALVDRFSRGRGGARRRAKTGRFSPLAFILACAALLIPAWAYRAWLASFLGGATDPAAAARASTRTGEPGASRSSILAAASPAGTAPAEAPFPLVLLFACAGALLAIVVTVLVARSGIGGPGRRPASREKIQAEEETPDQVVARIGRARAILETGEVARDAVIAAWAAMCELLGPRAAETDSPSLTPRELAALLARHGAAWEEVDILTRAFELARYSDEPVGEALRGDASAALRAIEERLARDAREER